MTIYDTLAKDHRKYESLMDRLVELSKANNDQWKQVLAELRDDLIPHAHAEESVFYNALREADPVKDLIRNSFAEHVKAETAVRALGAMKLIDANGTRLIEQLRQDLAHHIDQEENQVFPAARQIFSDEEARQIGLAFEKLKPEMAKNADSMVASAVDHVANLLPKRLVEGFRKAIHSRKGKAA